MTQRLKGGGNKIVAELRRVGLKAGWEGTAGHLCVFALWLFSFSPNELLSQQAKCTHVFRGVRGREVTLSPDARFVASAGTQDGTDDVIGLLLVWDLKTGKVVFRFRLSEAGFDTVCFSPDGKEIAGAGYGQRDVNLKSAKVWELPSGKEIAELKNDENISCLRFSPDGKFIAMATFDKKAHKDAIFIWDTRTFQKSGVLYGPSKTILKLAFSPDGEFLASADAAGAVHVWDFRKTTKPRKVDLTNGADAATSLCFSKDSKRILLATGFDARNGIHVLDRNSKEASPPLFHGQDAGVWSIHFTPDEQRIISCGSEFRKDKTGKKAPDGTLPEGTVQIWNLTKKKLEVRFKAHKIAVNCSAFSRDGTRLITASVSGTVKVWDLPKELLKK